MPTVQSQEGYKPEQMRIARTTFVVHVYSMVCLLKHILIVLRSNVGHLMVIERFSSLPLL
jgi:hypothetical protein